VSGRFVGPLRLAFVAGVLVALVPLMLRSGLGLFVVPPYAAVGAILVIRRPDNRIGWTVLATGAGFAILLTPSIHATAAQFADGSAPPVEQVLAVLTGGATGMTQFLLFFLLALIFPSGRWPGGRRGQTLRWVVGFAAACTAACFFRPEITVQLDGPGDPTAVHNPLSILPSLPIWGLLDPNILTFPIVVLFLGAVVSLVVRFRGSAGVERQQLRWVVGAVAFMAIAIIAGFALAAIAPAIKDLGLNWIPVLIAYPCVPIAIGIAVMRYRLYEIDRIVSRTISWTVTTGLVAGLFAGLIVALQAVLAPVTDENSLAVAASTLAAAALFQPIRRRVQSAVDHRFNRSRYDAERIVGGFATSLRGQIDLAQISGGVADAVTRSLRPETVGVWMRGRSEP
jgi:hypothetical protein